MLFFQKTSSDIFFLIVVVSTIWKIEVKLAIIPKVRGENSKNIWIATTLVFNVQNVVSW